MTAKEYRGALDQAIAEYERLGEERRRIDDRLAQLTQTIGTLSRLIGLEPTIPFGLTDACRLVYRNAGIPLSPTDVRERLRAMAVPGKQIYAWRTPTAAYAISPALAEHIRESGTFHVPSPPRRRSRRKK